MAQKMIFVRAICHGCERSNGDCNRPMRVDDWRKARNIQQFNSCSEYVPDGDCYSCFHRVHRGVNNIRQECVVLPEVKNVVRPGSCLEYVYREIEPLNEWLRKGHSDTGKYTEDMAFDSFETQCRPVPGSRKPGCFLTTACVEYFGLKDDCHLLQDMRQLRDQYVVKLPNGQQLVNEYIETSPGIVVAISKMSQVEKRLIYRFILRNVAVASTQVTEGQMTLAYETYASLYLRLKQELFQKAR